MGRIELTCPRCGKKLSVPSQKAGKRANCPRCGAALHIPLSDLPWHADPLTPEPLLAPAQKDAPRRMSPLLVSAALLAGIVLALAAGYALWARPLASHKSRLAEVEAELARVGAEAGQAKAEAAAKTAEVQRLSAECQAAKRAPAELKSKLDEMEQRALLAEAREKDLKALLKSAEGRAAAAEKPPVLQEKPSTAPPAQPAITRTAGETLEQEIRILSEAADWYEEKARNARGSDEYDKAAWGARYFTKRADEVRQRLGSTAR